MIDTKMFRVERGDGKEWLDGGQVPLGFDRVMRTQPELFTDEELARIIGEVSGRRQGVLAVSGVSSSGILTLTERGVSAVDGFEVFDFRLLHNEADLDRHVDKETIEEGRDQMGDYLAFDVPANATIDLVNRWLLSNYPAYSLDVDVTTHTNSGLGANVLTGLLGENRRPVEANGLTMIVRDESRKIRGKNAVDAYRGTQGYAGIAKSVRVVARRRPKNPAMLILPLNGNTIESAFAGSYADALARLAPWIYGEVEGTHISAADILDLTGLRTIHRVTHQGDMTGFKIPDFLSSYMDADHPSLICMRLEGEVLFAENEALSEAVISLSGDGVVGNLDYLDKNQQILPITARRGQVPERAREESLDRNLYSTSMDLDTKILFDDKSVDLKDERNQAAYKAAYQAIIRCYQPFEELQAHGIYLTWNGHFYLTNVADYYTGGHNPHPRVTGPIQHKKLISDAKKKVTTALMALHDKKFGPFTICVQEGEKHYPHDQLGQEHFAATQPHWSRERARLTAEAGLSHNARIPDPYREMMVRAGFPAQ